METRSDKKTDREAGAHTCCALPCCKRCKAGKGEGMLGPGLSLGWALSPGVFAQRLHLVTLIN